MAENKKSFLLYCDLIHTVSKMPDDKAGQLLKHVLEYVNDLNPQTNDLIIQLTFEPIKQQLKRDLLKYKAISEERSEIGKLGGIKSGEARRTKMKQNEANALKLKQNEQDTDTDTVIDKDINKEKDTTPLGLKLSEFLQYRKEIKKPIVNTSLVAFREKLKKLSKGNEAIAIQILNESMANGWTGIFELKAEQQVVKAKRL